MRNVWRVSLCLGVLMFAVSTAKAQRQRPGGGFGGPGALLSNKSVQEELKVTDEQKTKLADVTKKAGEMMQAKLKDVPRDQIREKMTAASKEIGEFVNKELSSVLKDGQVKRYKEISRQQMGVRAFSNDEVVSALKLTDEQKKDIKEAVEEGTKEITEKTKDLGFQDFQKRREISTEINKKTMGKVASKLTSEQKKTWKELTGEPFEVKFERPGGTRPGTGTTPGTRPGTRPGTPGTPARPRPDLSK